MTTESEGLSHRAIEPGTLWSIAAGGSPAPAGAAGESSVTREDGLVMGSRIQGYTRVLAMARPSPDPTGMTTAPTASERTQAARALEAGLASACALATASGRRLEPVKTAIVRAVLHRWFDTPEHVDAAAGTGTDLIVAVVGRGGVVIAAFGAWSAAAVAADGLHWLPEWEWEEDPEELGELGEEPEDAPRGLDDPDAARLAEVMWISPRHHVEGLWLGPAGSLDEVAGPEADADAVLSNVTAALREATATSALGAGPHSEADAPELSPEQSDTEPEMVPAWEQWVGERLQLADPVMVSWAPPGTLGTDAPAGAGSSRGRFSARLNGHTKDRVSEGPVEPATSGRTARWSAALARRRQPSTAMSAPAPLLGEPEVMDRVAPLDSAPPARTTVTGSRPSSPRSSTSQDTAEQSRSDGIRMGPIALVVAVILAILAVPAWALSRPSPSAPTTPSTPVASTSSSIAATTSPSPTRSVSESASQSASPSVVARTPAPTRLATRTPASSTASTEPSTPETSAPTPTPTTPSPTLTVTSTPDPTTPSPTISDPTETPTPSP